MTTNTKEYWKAYSEKNREKIKKQKQEHYQKNKEKIKQQEKEYRQKNKDNPEYKLRKNKNSKKFQQKPEVRERRRKNGGKWRMKNKEKVKEYKITYRKNYPEQVKTHSLSQQIPKKSACEICGSKENLEKHHWRYDKPLMVNTLCRTCHTIQHIKHFDSPHKFIPNLIK